MLKIRRNDLLPNAAFRRVRRLLRDQIIALKRRRRIPLGPHMSLVFENRETILYHIQEVLLIEQITDEIGIARELAEYNRLLPRPGELSATLFLEFTDRRVGNAVVGAIGDLDSDIALRFGDVSAHARFVAQAAEGLSAVNYLRFTLDADHQERLLDCHGDVTLASSNPAYLHESPIPYVTCLYLAVDLLSNGSHRLPRDVPVAQRAAMSESR